MTNLTPKQINDIESHLRSRGVDPSHTQVIMDKENNMATFILYNLSGQLIGYQRYNPNGDKKLHGDTLAAKYFTWVTKESPGTSKLAVWGIENIDKNNPNLFVAEGIFDAIKLKNAGLPAIAVLTNNPKLLKSWFTILNKNTISITDNDAAGKKLGNITDETYSIPDNLTKDDGTPIKDLGDMSQEQVNQFLSGIGHSPSPQSPPRSVNKTLTPQKNHDVIKKMLNTKVKNPETGNDILVKTALKYDKSHPSYKQAKGMTDTWAKRHGIKIRDTR